MSQASTEVNSTDEMSIIDTAPMILAQRNYIKKIYEVTRTIGWLNPLVKRTFEQRPEPNYKTNMNSYYYDIDKPNEGTVKGREQLTLRRYDSINADMFN